MNRLQKKCLIATTGFHLLLVVILVFGSAFFVTHSKPDDTQVLEVIPDVVVDAAFSSGVKNAQPPPPTPPQPPVQQIVQPPTPPPPQPQPKPVEVTPPPPKPAPTLVERVEKIFKPEPPKPAPDEVKTPEPEPKPVKPKHEIKPVLTLATRNAPSAADTRAADAARREQQQRDARLKAIAAITSRIKENSSTSTEINLSGNSSESYANYGAAVLTAYHQAWVAPNNMATDEAVVRFSVTISSDGSVISARVVKSSGDSSVDGAVRRMLDRVHFIQKFPADTKDKQRTYNIDFNATRTSNI